MTDNERTPYDEVIYPGHPIPQTHPDRLATLATMFGMKPAPVPNCRVLELGCGIGGNLLSLAYQWPQSTFVGIDLSERSIQTGLKNVAELGLGNIDLRHLSIMDVTPEFGQFDYIIAHGVYSWVPPPVRAKVLSIFKHNLAPQGVAFVSFNAYPGSHFRKIASDMMLFHVRTIGDPSEKIAQARTLMEFASELSVEDDLYAMIVRDQAKWLKGKADEVIYHDDLDPNATAMWLHQVMEEADRHGLQYLWEAAFSRSSLGALPDPVVNILKQIPASEIVVREQYLDFLAASTFRQTLLCHDGIELRRTVEPSCVRDFFLAGYAAPESGPIDPSEGGSVKFKTRYDTRIATDHPLTKAALLHLGENWPDAISFPELVKGALTRLGAAADRTSASLDEQVKVVTGVLYRAFAADQIELHLYRPPLTIAISERPRASLLARKLAEAGPLVTNMRHTRVMLNDELTRRFLGLVDGTRTIDQLLADLNGMLATMDVGALDAKAESGAPTGPEVTRENVERNLKALATLGLLVA